MKRGGEKKKGVLSLAKTKTKDSKKQPDKNVQSIDNSKQSPKNKSNWKYIVFGIILLILIICVAYLFILNNNSKKEIQPNIIKEEVIIGGREFIFAKDENVKNAPVIIFLHGGAQDNNIWFSENDQALIVKSALAEGYAVIAPNSLKPLCEGVKQWDYRENSSDLAFFDEIFNYIWSRDDLDSDRIYVTGISIGGFMTSRLAEHYGDSINAIAIYAGGNADNLFVYPPELCYVEYDYNLTNINANHPRTLLIHGDSDTTIPLEASVNYYNALEEAGRGAKLIIKEHGEHRWYPEDNEAILNWFN